MTTDRLDRIEAILDGLAQSAQARAGKMHSLSQQVGTLSQQIGELTRSCSLLKQDREATLARFSILVESANP